MARHGLAEGPEIAWLHDTIRRSSSSSNRRPSMSGRGNDIPGRWMHRKVPVYNAMAILGTLPLTKI
jgi:hypothetical protein